MTSSREVSTELKAWRHAISMDWKFPSVVFAFKKKERKGKKGGKK